MANPCVAAEVEIEGEEGGHNIKGLRHLAHVHSLKIAISLRYSTQPRAWGGGDAVDFSSRSPPRPLTFEGAVF
jgi:hypothetical protein